MSSSKIKPKLVRKGRWKRLAVLVQALMFRTISTVELAQRLDDQHVAIVDVRPIAAYNGWCLKGEARGGHIRRAVTCPLAWIELLSSDKLRVLLVSKGVVPDKDVIVYGYDHVETEAFAGQLAKLGYEAITVYQAGFATWAGDPDLPVQRLARYERLVPPQWLQGLINEQDVEAKPNNSYIICHVTFGFPRQYEAAHIPGAIYLDTNDLEDDRYWNRRSPAELQMALTAHGIARDTTAVIYGHDEKTNVNQAHPERAAGQIAAARAASILMYAGVEDVRLLDGGLNAWLANGYESEKGWLDPVPVPKFGAKIPVRPEYFVDIAGVRRLLADPGGVLVSVRSWREFSGETSGYRTIGPRGHIPGAVWGYAGTDAYHMQHYRNVDNSMRAYHEIAASWQSAGITPDKRIAFYCGTGWRASEAFFYAYLLGWPRIAVYDGGWYEWSTHNGRHLG